MPDSAQNKIPYVPQDTLDPAAGLNDAIRVIDALLNTRAVNMTTNAPPGSPTDGVCYVIAGAPTGVWTGHARALAQYVADGAFWNFYEAGVNAWLVLNMDDGNLYKWDPDTPAWEQAAGIGEAPLDSHYYGRKDGTWAAMPDVTNMVTSVNDMTPDSSGNVDIPIPTTIVESVNSHGPDSNGNVDVPLYRLAGINDQTGASYTLVASDIGKDVRCTRATAVAVLVPEEDVDHPWMVDSQPCMVIISQGGAGAVSAVAAASNVQFVGPNGVATTALGDARVLQYLGSDTWRVW